MDRWLTDERKRVFVDTFGFSFNLALGVIAAVWLVLALIVGSVEMFRWIGAIA